MAGAPPGRRLSVVALVAAARRFGAREGAARRGPEVTGGESAPRVVLSPGESPVDASGVDPADPRPRMARSYRRLGGRSPRPGLGELRREPLDPGRGGNPSAGNLAGTVPSGGIQLDRGPGASVLRNQPERQAGAGSLQSVPRRNRAGSPTPSVVRSRDHREVQGAAGRGERPRRDRGPHRRGETCGRLERRARVRVLVLRGPSSRISTRARASCSGQESLT